MMADFAVKLHLLIALLVISTSCSKRLPTRFMVFDVTLFLPLGDDFTQPLYSSIANSTIEVAETLPYGGCHSLRLLAGQLT